MSAFLNWLNELDRSFFIFLNGHHQPWLDQVMWYVSKMQTWFPVYLLMLILLYRKIGLRNFFLAIGCVALLLFLTDFLAVHLVKNTVMRLRPSHDPQIKDLVNLVADPNGNLYRGGQFGFFSNHSSNHFGVVGLFIYLMKPLRTSWIILLYAWVLLITYSRIYLGVHYPGDILAGALYGSIAALLVSRIYHYISDRWIKS